jgi:hypothetical protein
MGAATCKSKLDLVHPRRSFPVDQNPSGMPETTSFSYPIFTSIFPKARLHTNSLIRKYCSHTLRLARASKVNITGIGARKLVA